jgi:hypothetical protein
MAADPPKKDPATEEDEPRYALDEQTGHSFRIRPEKWYATVIAGISAVYLICALVFLLWLLLDTWAGQNQILVRWGYPKALLASDTFRLMAFVAIGGALGATVDGLRSLVAWHSERSAYGPRFI